MYLPTCCVRDRKIEGCSEDYPVYYCNVQHIRVLTDIIVVCIHFQTLLPLIFFLISLYVLFEIRFWVSVILRANERVIMLFLDLCYRSSLEPSNYFH